MEFASSRYMRATCSALALLVTALAAGGALGQTISGIPESASHGNSVQITGSGFGTKATAAPIIYDDFENGNHADYISTAAGWDEVGLTGVQKPRYDNELKHAGNNSMKLFWDNGQYASSVRKGGDFKKEFYLDGWFQYDQEDAPYSRVVKLALLFGDSPIQYPQVHIGTANCTQNEAFHVAGYANVNTASGNVYVFKLGDLIGKFNHIQVWLKASDSGVANGKVRVWFNGRLIASSDTYLTVAGNEGYWNHVRLGYYHAHDGIPGMCEPSPGDAYGWWDNVYIDNSQARVELGNSATYENCTNRETQVATSWAPDQITFDFKQGTFQPGDPAWLYVTNPDGSRSSGRQIGIGGTAVSGPGMPGQPVVIN